LVSIVSKCFITDTVYKHLEPSLYLPHTYSLAMAKGRINTANLDRLAEESCGEALTMLQGGEEDEAKTVVSELVKSTITRFVRDVSYFKPWC